MLSLVLFCWTIIDRLIAMTENTSAVGQTGATALQWAVETLRNRFVEGRLLPGTPLREVSLAEDLKISRNTLREALRQLAAENLIEVQAYRGAVVRTITADDVRDLYLVRRTLELRAVEQSATAAPSSLIALATACQISEAAVSAGDWREAATSSLRFHQALVATLDSPRLDGFFRTVIAQIRLAFAQGPDEAAFQSSFVPRDREVCDLMAAGSIGTAAAELRRYLDDAEAVLLKVVLASSHHN